MASPITATPLPLYTAVPDVPADLTAAVNNLEKFVIGRFATATARDAAITLPVAGMVCYVTGTGFQQYNGTAWVALLPTVPTVPAIQGGVATLAIPSAAANVRADASFTGSFAAGRFSATPNLVASWQSASAQSLGLLQSGLLRTNPTSSSAFQIYTSQISTGTITAYNLPTAWMAIDTSY